MRITTVTLLEIGYSARDARDVAAGLQGPPVGSMPVQYATPVTEDRAVAVLRLLADRGHHRAPSVPDLIVAATAESAGLVVLHNDKDFDLIAQITGQPVQRLDISDKPAQARINPETGEVGAVAVAWGFLFG